MGNRISVILACYSGEKTILRQLESLRLQTLSPDEVLVFDDASPDETSDVVRQYIERYRLQGWKLIRNQQNLGWKQNFFHGMMEASGDILFLCDQDDEWNPRKIEKMTSALASHSFISLLACDFDLQYGRNAIPFRKYRKKKAETAGTMNYYQFTSRFFQNPSPGCTYAIRREFIREVAPFWFPEAPHDEFLWLFAALTNRAAFYNEKLMTIHRGEENASDIRFKDIALQKENLRYIAAMLDALEQYTTFSTCRIPQNHADHLAKAQIWCQKRQHLLETKNPFLWLAMFPYWKYYNSFRNCLSDLYLVLFGSFHRS